MNGFCYLGDRLNSNGGCAAVTVRVRIGRVRFRKCSQLLLENKFPMRMKAKVHRCCLRSAILHESEAYCLKEKQFLGERRELWSEPCAVRKLLTERRLKN